MAQASGPLPVAVLGLGFIGRRIAEAALASPELSLVGAADRRGPSGRAGRPLSEFVPGAPAKMKVDDDLARLLPLLRGGVLLHTAGSRLADVLPAIQLAARAGVHVVSTCEELAFPWLRFEEQADALDDLAKRSKICVLGTGANPGFVLDRLVATAGAACGSVQSVRAGRVVDLVKCRESVRVRAGLGLSEDEVERRFESGEAGHIGLAESAALCALGLGLDFEEYEEELEPLVAEEDLAGPVPVKKGQVAGIRQRVRGFHEDRQTVELELTLVADAEDPHDFIRLEADPKVELRVAGGYASDAATVWSVINAAPRVCAAEHGLLTVLELPAGR